MLAIYVYIFWFTCGYSFLIEYILIYFKVLVFKIFDICLNFYVVIYQLLFAFKFACNKVERVCLYLMSPSRFITCKMYNRYATNRMNHSYLVNNRYVAIMTSLMAVVAMQLTDSR